MRLYVYAVVKVKGHGSWAPTPLVSPPSYLNV